MTNGAQSFEAAKKELTDLLSGTVKTLKDGVEKTFTKPKYVIEQEADGYVRAYLHKRGEFFRAPGPYFHDQLSNTLVPLHEAAPEFRNLLHQLGIPRSSTFYKLLSHAIIDAAASSPKRTVSRFAEMRGENSYIRNSANSMLRISTDQPVEVVPIGTDGVYLIADDIADLPDLGEIERSMEELRPFIGWSTISPVKDSPMTKALTTRWSSAGSFTPEQAHGLFLARTMFMTVANEFTIWPFLLFTGEGGSGKSTPAEIFLSLLQGRMTEAPGMPLKADGIAAMAANRTLVVFDNCDEAVKTSEVNNLLCLMSTGGLHETRKLYANNEVSSVSIHAHTFLTARVNPFTRSDVMRRTLELEVEKSGADADKAALFRDALANRTAIIAELILRTQNVLRALKKDSKPTTVSQIAEFEAFTLRCAAFENTTNKWSALWKSAVAAYQTSITEDNSIVHAVRMWLGQDPSRSGKEIGAFELHAEITKTFEKIGGRFSVRADNALGKILQSNRTNLRVLGYEFSRRSAGARYSFKPAPDVLAACEMDFIRQYGSAMEHRIDMARDINTPVVPRPSTPPTEDDNIEELNFGPNPQRIN